MIFVLQSSGFLSAHANFYVCFITYPCNMPLRHIIHSLLPESLSGVARSVATRSRQGPK